MSSNTIPALAGFWSDPTICAADGRFVLAHSSFEYFPGVPIHVSDDLITWEHIGHVVDRPTQTRLVGGGPSSGIYGSTIRYHDGRYWFISTNMAAVLEGQLLFTAERPEGPWSDPIKIPVIGIDPDIAWDETGNCIVTWRRLPQGIAQVRINPESGDVLSEPISLWSGTGMRHPEGPHIYKVGDWWYLLIAEGGTDRGHSVSVARSRSVHGPFVGNPANPILTHRSTDHPVQSVGHADLVEGPGGQWYAVYHGTRPKGGFPQFHVLGRETFLAKVVWQDEWPVIVEEDGRVAATDTSFEDCFDAGLDVRWVQPAGDLSGVRVNEGALILDHPVRPVLTRVRAHDWEATATLDVGNGSGRILVYIDDRHFYGLQTTPSRVGATVRVGDLAQDFGHIDVAPGHPVDVRITARTPVSPPHGPRATEPDIITLSVGQSGVWQELARLDGRYISTEVAGGFTGRMVGVDATQGRVTCTRFSYQEIQPHR